MSQKREPSWDDLENALTPRCEAAGIRLERKNTGSKYGDGVYFALHLKDGRETRAFPLFGKQSLQLLLDSEFEKVRAVPSYQAIRLPEERRCVVFLDSRTLRLEHRQEQKAFTELLRSLNLGDGASASLSVASPDGSKTLTLRLASEFEQLFSVSYQRSLVIAADGFDVTQSDAAMGVIEGPISSLLFQLDHTAPFGLLPARSRDWEEDEENDLAAPSVVPPSFPTTKHPAEPLSLYWYAKRAQGTPLLQYLSYYQVIEFFFPRYSKIEAQKRVRNILLDPAFRPSNARDVSRVVSAVEATTKGRFGDERSKLKATIRECISEDDLRTFLRDKPRQAFFLGPNGTRAARQQLSCDSAKADLVTEVASRIYEIRCRIVHAKDGSDGAQNLLPLLPFSKDARYLTHDNALVQWVASRVIAASSESLD